MSVRGILSRAAYEGTAGFVECLQRITLSGRFDNRRVTVPAARVDAAARLH